MADNDNPFAAGSSPTQTAPRPAPTQSNAGDNPFAAPAPTPGKSDNPFAAVDPINRGIIEGTKSIYERLMFAKNHPVEGFSNVLGAPQRAVGEIARQMQNARRGEQYRPGDIVESIFNPNEEVNRRTTESIRALVHAPTKESIDQWVDGLNLSDEQKDWMKTVAETSEDVALQSMSDPLTLADGFGLVAKIGAVAIRGGRTAQAMHAAASAVGMGKAFEHLQQAARNYAGAKSVTSKLADRIRNQCVRPDLDPIFSQEGKRLRMQIENKWYTRIGAYYPKMEEVAKDDEGSRKLFLDFLHRTGSTEDQRLIEREFGAKPPNPNPSFVGDRFDFKNVGEKFRQKKIEKGKIPTQSEMAAHISKEYRKFENSRLKSIRTQVKAFSAMNPDERLAELNKLRSSYRDQAINSETAELAKNVPTMLKDGVANVEFDKLATRDKYGESALKVIEQLPLIGTMLEKSRAWSRNAILANPFIHEVRNVGQLARLAGGLHMVPFMVQKVAKNSRAGEFAGASADELKTLDRAGALQTFLHDEHQTGGIWNTPVGPALKKIQSLTQAMDTGYRAALWKTMEKTQGTAADNARYAVARMGLKEGTPEYDRALRVETQKNELLMGRAIQERIGDPRNQDRFVQFFQAFGGWFPVFRLGIVPRNVLATLFENPGRVALPIREQADFNANRRANDQTEYIMGGPTTDFAELVSPFNTIDYGLSPSSLGEIGEIIRLARRQVPLNPQNLALSVAEPLLPFGYEARDLYEAITGQSVDQPSSFGDALLYHFLNYLTSYYEKKQPNPNVLQREQRLINQEFQEP